MSENQEVQEEKFNINGRELTVIVETRAKRNGNGAKSTSYIPKLAPGEIVSFLISLWGSPEKVAAVLIRDIIKPMGHEASSDAYNAETQEFSERLYGESLVQYGEPASRRKGGLTVRDIQTRLAEIAPEFTVLVGEFTANGGHFTSDENTNRFQQLMLEQQQLTAALAAKNEGAGERKAKKAKKAKAKADATPAAPAEIAG